MDINPKNNSLPDVFNYVDLESVKGSNLVDFRKEFKKSAPSRAQRIAKTGDIFFQTVRPYQRNNYIFEINSDVPFVFSSGYAQLRPKLIHGHFMANKIQRNSFVIEVLKRCTGTSYPAITPKDLASINIEMPNNINEQKMIGLLLKKIDETITLHQRKLIKLEQLKKSFLSSMFPKKDNDIPSLRFSNFNGPWEQRKLNEVSERVQGNDGRMELPTLTISASQGWLDQRERFSSNIAGKEQKKYTLLSKGELSYNHGNSKVAKYGAVFELRTYKEALVPRVYHSFSTNGKAFATFIEYMFATKQPDRELRKLITSGARMDGLLNINYDSFMSININIPSLVEQKEISNLLRQLDSTIVLHQNKLDTLQKVKKSYLKKMFI